ncbi:MAG: hypothetical protein ACI4KF_06050 [Huintestinicola sp.]
MNARKKTNGIALARDIIIIITMALSVASLVLMIIECAANHRSSNGIIRFRDSDEIPF